MQYEKNKSNDFFEIPRQRKLLYIEMTCTVRVQVIGVFQGCKDFIKKIVEGKVVMNNTEMLKIGEVAKILGVITKTISQRRNKK